MKDKVKNILIIALIILIGLFGFFGGRKVVKYQEQIGLLKLSNKSLEEQIAKRDGVIQSQNDTIEKKEAKIASLMLIFRSKDKQIAELTTEIDLALEWLDFITADSSYIFLQEVAYNYPGALKYLFNELQIKYIHADYVKARSSEKIIPVLTSQINNCREQFTVRDSTANALRGIVVLQEQSLADCKQINENNNKVILDTEKQRDAEKRRKFFWRATTGIMTGVTIVLAVFGI